MRKLLLASLMMLAACEPATPPKPTPQQLAARRLVTDTAAARMYVTQILRDPESARFRNVRIGYVSPSEAKDLPGDNSRGQTRTIICGEINARSGLGGYLGYAPFAAVLGGSPQDIAIMYEPVTERDKMMVKMAEISIELWCQLTPADWHQANI